jgi:hypothetical protein
MDAMTRVARLLAGFAVALAVTGCADFGAVRTYAAETKKLSTAFATIPQTTVDLCEARITLGQQTLSANSTFNVENVRQLAATTCAPLNDQSAKVQGLVTLLDEYANTLGALSDDSLPNFNPELETLQTTAVELTGKGGELVIPEDKAKAVVSLARAITRIATERAARSGIRELLDQAEGVNAVTAALRWYAERITKPELDVYAQNARLIMDKSLPQFEKTEPIGARIFAVTLSSEQKRLKDLAAANDDLIAAFEKHQRATATVREKFDKPDDKVMREQLFDLAKDLNRAQRHLRKAF